MARGPSFHFTIGLSIVEIQPLELVFGETRASFEMKEEIQGHKKKGLVLVTLPLDHSTHKRHNWITSVPSEVMLSKNHPYYHIKAKRKTKASAHLPFFSNRTTKILGKSVPEDALGLQNTIGRTGCKTKNGICRRTILGSSSPHLSNSFHPVNNQLPRVEAATSRSLDSWFARLTASVKFIEKR